MADRPETRIRHILCPEKACDRLCPQFGDSKSVLACSFVVRVAFDEHEIVKILNQPAGEQPVGIGSHDGGPNSDNVCAIGLEEYVLERGLVSEPLQILR